MDFDEVIDRRGTHSSKWDTMQGVFGVSPDDGIAMWVADMDFRTAPCITQALRDYADFGLMGYYGDYGEYHAAIDWWMRNRHGWSVKPEWILTTHGLVNGTGLCVQAYTEPGDAVVLFTPVYHAFARVIRAAGREVVECPLVQRDGRYEMDFDTWDAQMSGREKMVILCSPHNPGGRCWNRDELRAVADFARRHDLVLVSDEIHQDLVFPGATHLPTALAAPEIADRLVVMNAPTKTFNIAGAHTGQVIIPDAALRKVFAERLTGLGLSPNSFGLVATTAAYSAEGAAWVDALIDYLDGNRRLFDAAIADIPGLRSMPLEGTYLSWVDFSDTGMSPDEAIARVEGDARIAANHGATFGSGGESFLRFNFATPRARVEEAAARLAQAFGDLQ